MGFVDSAKPLQELIHLWLFGHPQIPKQLMSADFMLALRPVDRSSERQGAEKKQTWRKLAMENDSSNQQTSSASMALFRRHIKDMFFWFLCVSGCKQHIQKTDMRYSIFSRKRLRLYTCFFQHAHTQHLYMWKKVNIQGQNLQPVLLKDSLLPAFFRRASRDRYRTGQISTLKLPCKVQK